MKHDHLLGARATKTRLKTGPDRSNAGDRLQLCGGIERHRGTEMTAQSSLASPILVTGAAGAVGSIGRNVTEMLLANGHKVASLGAPGA